MQQGVGDASIARAFCQRYVLSDGGLWVVRSPTLFGIELLPLSYGQKVIPIFDPENVARVASAEKKQSRHKAACLDKHIQQLLAGELIMVATRLRQF